MKFKKFFSILYLSFFSEEQRNAKRLYRDILGFKMWMNYGQLTIRLDESSYHIIYINGKPQEIPIYFRVSDIDHTFQRVTNMGFKIEESLVQIFEEGRGFSFRDPFGILVFILERQPLLSNLISR